MVKRKNTHYEEEFKNSIVNLYNSGKTITDLCGEYGVPKSTIRQWIMVKKELTEDCGEGKITMEDFIRLKKEIAFIKEENEILKKALTIFAKK